MNVIIALAISGLVMSLAPLFLARTLLTEVSPMKSLFMRVGLWFLLISLVQVILFGNISSTFPALDALPVVVRALVYGLLTGLFTELLRHVLLDKFFDSIRSYKKAIYFGFCTTALMTLIVGVIIFLGSFGLSTIAQTNDLSSFIASSAPDDLEQAKIFQDQARELLAQPFYLGFGPVIEKSAFMFFDITLTVLIVLGLVKGETKYAWGAVFARTAVTSSFYMLSFLGNIFPLFGVVVLGVASAYFVFTAKKYYPKELQGI